jgi:hypothetical protein
MAVTKRLRYEVLRRDNHACRYCGATAPDVKLTVDHVTPQALGGSDDPSNLVTACDACNSGKTSVPADAPIVADVQQDALRWAAAMEEAAAQAHAKYEVRLDYRGVFREAWEEWNSGPEHAQKPVPLDLNWETSLDNFYEAGLPEWELKEAVRAAMSNPKVTPANTFRYFAGICWTKIRQMQEAARQLIQPETEAPASRWTTDTVNDIVEHWMSAYQERCEKAGIDSSRAATDRLRDRVVGYLDQGFSIDRVRAAAGRAGEGLALNIADYFEGSYGDLMFDAMATWAIAWSSTDPDNPRWKSSVPSPTAWNDLRAEIRGAIAAGAQDVQILAACEKAGGLQEGILIALPDWPGRWGDDE